MNKIQIKKEFIKCIPYISIFIIHGMFILHVLYIIIKKYSNSNIMISAHLAIMPVEIILIYVCFNKKRTKKKIN